MKYFLNFHKKLVEIYKSGLIFLYVYVVTWFGWNVYSSEKIVYFYNMNLLYRLMNDVKSKNKINIFYFSCNVFEILDYTENHFA